LYKPSAEKIEKCIIDSYELPNKVIEIVKRPVVSVITITYNHADYIQRCIESVMMQKVKFPIEYIIGEDFSTDKTKDIVREYASKYPEIIRVITADYNIGMLANSARCMKNARGMYIALCEGDDYWTDPLKLQKQVKFLELKPEYVMCYHYCLIINAELKKERLIPNKKIDYSSEELVASPKKIASATKLFRNVFTSTNSNFPIQNYYDYFLNSYLGIYGDCKFISSIKPSVYNIHSGGVWSSLDVKTQIYEMVDIFNDIYSYFLEVYLVERKDDRLLRIRLKVLKDFLNRTWDRLDSKNKSFYVSSSYTRIAFHGVWVEIYYKPILRSIKITYNSIKRFSKKIKKKTIKLVKGSEKTIRRKFIRTNRL
jgi:glycosyltransferase involved in cell wall biosynthesis